MPKKRNANKPKPKDKPEPKATGKPKAKKATNSNKNWASNRWSDEEAEGNEEDEEERKLEAVEKKLAALSLLPCHIEKLSHDYVADCLTMVAENIKECVWLTLVCKDWQTICKAAPFLIVRSKQNLDMRQLRKFLPGCPGIALFTGNYAQKINDKGLRHLIQLPELRELRLVDCRQLNGTGFAELAGHQNLQKLDLSFCRLLINEGVSALGGLPALTSLDLGHCQSVGDDGVTALLGLGLQKLSLSWCARVTDAAVATLPPSLEHLELNGCRHVTDIGLCSLAQRNPQLRHLNLAYCCEITDVGLHSLVLGKQEEAKIVEDTSRRRSVLAPPTPAGLALLQELYLIACTLITDEGVEALRVGLPSLVEEQLILVGCRGVTAAGELLEDESSKWDALYAAGD